VTSGITENLRPQSILFLPLNKTYRFTVPGSAILECCSSLPLSVPALPRAATRCRTGHLFYAHAAVTVNLMVHQSTAQDADLFRRRQQAGEHAKREQAPALPKNGPALPTHWGSKVRGSLVTLSITAADYLWISISHRISIKQYRFWTIIPLPEGALRTQFMGIFCGFVCS